MGRTLFEGPASVVGDKITVTRRGRTFEARVIWGNWRGHSYGEEMIVPLRVKESSALAAIFQRLVFGQK